MRLGLGFLFCGGKLAGIQKQEHVGKDTKCGHLECQQFIDLFLPYYDFAELNWVAQIQLCWCEHVNGQCSHCIVGKQGESLSFNYTVGLQGPGMQGVVN